MSPLRALSLAATVAIAPQVARAADMLPPPPMVEAPLRGAIIADPGEMSGWYIRGDVGVNINTATYDSTFNATNALGGPAPLISTLGVPQKSLGDTAFIRAGFGYQFNNWFRADITAEHHTSAQYHKTLTYTQFCPVGSTFCQDTYSGDVGANVFLVNGYVDLGTWYGLTPYVGAGVGLASLKMQGLTDTSSGQAGTAGGTAPDTSKSGLAWAVMAGLSYNINSRLKLEMGYRYLNMPKLTSGAILCTSVPDCFFERQGVKMSSSDFHIGMRWMFADSMGSSGMFQGSSVALPSAHPCCGGAAAGYGGGAVVGAGGYGGGQVVSGGGYGGGQVVSGPRVAAGGYRNQQPGY
jgi:opacity protein-like surface antigen